MEMLFQKEAGTANVMASTTDAAFFRHENTFERYQSFAALIKKPDHRTETRLQGKRPAPKPSAF